MLRRFLQIRPDETRGAFGAFGVLFTVLAGHTLLETARDALFLAQLPADRLPWVYLVIALLAALLGRLKLPGRDRLDRRLLLTGWLAFAALVTLGFAGLSSGGAEWALYALYVWAGLFASVALVLFWLLLGSVYTVSQAKRLFGFIGAGSLSGAMAGAAAARLIAEQLDGQALLVAAAAVLLISAAQPLIFVPRAVRADLGPEDDSVLRGFRLLRSQPYMRRVAVLVVVSTAAFTLVDFVFKSEVARLIDRAELATFFAGFYFVLNGVALLVQLGLVGWLLRTLGIHRALWVLPILVGTASIGVTLGGGLIAIVFLKGADGSLRHSLFRTSIELLYVPVADGLRSRTKPVIDVLGHRGGQAITSLAILAAVALDVTIPLLALGVVALAILWVVVAGELHSDYLEQFRVKLREGAIDTRLRLRALDLGALETLFQALNSSDDDEVLGALDLLAQQRRVALVPALILYHPSTRVVLQALETFVEHGRMDFLPMTERLLSQGDPEVRAAVLRVRSRLQPDEDELRRALSDDSPLVRATAAVGLAFGGDSRPDSVTDRLRQVSDFAAAEQAQALARAIQLQPSPRFVAALLRLAEQPDEAVRYAVARAMQAVAHADFVPVLIDWVEERGLRAAARNALVAIGGPALRQLHLCLHDRAIDVHLRRHIPRTISHFANERAAEILLNHLLDERDGVVRYKILRGLNRIRADHPEIAMGGSILQQALGDTLGAAFHLMDWRCALQRGGAADERRRTRCHRLMVALLADKEGQTLERTFRLLGLRYLRENFERIYRGVTSTDPRRQASARELLEHVLEPDFKGALLALIDDIPDEDKLALAPPLHEPARLDYTELLAAMLDEGSQSLQALAAYHVAELGVDSLTDRLVGLRSTGDAYLERVFERALSRLTTASAQGVVHDG